MTTLSIACDVHFNRRAHGAKHLQAGTEPATPVAVGRMPRVARLMALAIRFDHLVRSGAVKDYATLARLAQVSRARISQIMNLLHLAPDIQEALLFLPRIERERHRPQKKRADAMAAEADLHAAMKRLAELDGLKNFFFLQSGQRGQYPVPLLPPMDGPGKVLIRVNTAAPEVKALMIRKGEEPGPRSGEERLQQLEKQLGELLGEVKKLRQEMNKPGGSR